jgi:hypothetical protein
MMSEITIVQKMVKEKWKRFHAAASTALTLSVHGTKSAKSLTVGRVAGFVCAKIVTCAIDRQACVNRVSVTVLFL